MYQELSGRLPSRVALRQKVPQPARFDPASSQRHGSAVTASCKPKTKEQLPDLRQSDAGVDMSGQSLGASVSQS